MRALFVSHGYPPEESAGAEWETRRRAIALAARGHDVSVLVITSGSTDAVRVNEPRWDEGVRIVRGLLPNEPDFGDPAEYDNPEVRVLLKDELRAFCPDLVHVISGYRVSGAALDLAVQRRLPVFLTVTDFWLACPRITLLRKPEALCRLPVPAATCVACLSNEWRRYRLPYRATRGLSAQLMRPAAALGAGPGAGMSRYIAGRRQALHALVSRASAVISASRFLADALVASGFEPDNIHVMRQGLDMDAWAPRDERAPAPPSTLRIGFIGQLAAHKGVRDAVEAVEGIDPSAASVELRVHGDVDGASPDLRSFLTNSATRDSRIRLMGPFRNTDIRRVHQGIDVLVVPSRWYENSPNVVLEAFACGTPVVVSDLGGLAELVSEGRGGLCFPVRDVEALRSTIVGLSRDLERLERLRERIPPVRSIADEVDELEALYGAYIPRSQPLGLDRR